MHDHRSEETFNKIGWYRLMDKRYQLLIDEQSSASGAEARCARCPLPVACHAKARTFAIHCAPGALISDL